MSLRRVRQIVTRAAINFYDDRILGADKMTPGEKVRHVEAIRRAVRELEGRIGIEVIPEGEKVASGSRSQILGELTIEAQKLERSLDLGWLARIDKSTLQIARTLRSIAERLCRKSPLDVPGHNPRSGKLYDIMALLPTYLCVLSLACDAWLLNPPEKQPKRALGSVNRTFLHAANGAYQQITGLSLSRSRQSIACRSRQSIAFARRMAGGMGFDITDPALRSLLSRNQAGTTKGYQVRRRAQTAKKTVPV